MPEPQPFAICEGGVANGMKIYDASDAASCRYNGGEIGMLPGDGGTHRIAESLFREYVDPVTDEGDEIPRTTVLYFPLCTMRRRFPHSRFIVELDQLDIDGTSQLAKILSDDKYLRQKVLRFILDAAYVATKATALEGSTDSPAPPIPTDLVKTGRDLCDTFGTKVTDQGVLDKLADLKQMSSEFEGATVLDLFRLLRQWEQSAS